MGGTAEHGERWMLLTPNLNSTQSSALTPRARGVKGVGARHTGELHAKHSGVCCVWSCVAGLAMMGRAPSCAPLRKQGGQTAGGSPTRPAPAPVAYNVLHVCFCVRAMPPSERRRPLNPTHTINQRTRQLAPGTPVRTRGGHVGRDADMMCTCMDGTACSGHAPCGSDVRFGKRDA